MSNNTGKHRMGGRVVEGGSLENCCTRKGTLGSNPSPSAYHPVVGVTRHSEIALANRRASCLLKNAILAFFNLTKLRTEFFAARKSTTTSLIWHHIPVMRQAR